MGKEINEAKLIGGKRKNGHKFNCTCHICENMKNKARRGGYEEEVEKAEEKMMGGSKKKNGHRRDCNCPICKNMKNSKKRGGYKSIRRTKKMRGGDDSYEENTDSSDDEETDDEETDDEEMDKEEIEESVSDFEGGKKKKKKGNGHKPGCQCPICKNMRKKKGGSVDEEIGNIEEGGIKATDDNQIISTSEIKASEEDYDVLDAAEKGQAGQNVVGGTRKRQRRHKRLISGKKSGGKRRTRRRKMRRYS